MIYRRTRLTVLAAADATALIVLAPDWYAIGRQLADVEGWVAHVGADRAAAVLAGAALWLCAVWLGAAVAVLVLAGAPGRFGAFGRRSVDVIVPAALARILSGAAGLSISLVALSPSAAVAASGPATAPMGDLAGPTTSLRGAGPTWPMTPVAVAIPVVDPTSAPSTHVVAPGDCLWNLAAAQLASDVPGHLGSAAPGRIAEQTERWYRANRSVIGANPSLLRPGQVLVEPTRPN